MTTQAERLNVEVRQTNEGRKIVVKNRWGEGRNVTIDREWEVLLDGEVVGHIRYAMITRERKGKGMRYVYARWQSPGWEYHTPGYGARWAEGYGKQESIDRVVRNALDARRRAEG